jgi:hypothetical protein
MHELSCRTLTLRLDEVGRAIGLVHRASGCDYLKDQQHPVGLWELGLIRPVVYDDPLPPIEVPDTELYKGRQTWENRHEYEADLLLDSTGLTPTIAGDAGALSLAWTVPVPGGLASVTLRITGGESDELRFHFSAMLPEDWAIKRAAYPRLRGFGDWTAPDEDMLLYPENWGVLRRNPLEDMTDYAGQYPSASNWAQMAAWFHGDAGLYLGILDPDSNYTGIDMQYAEGAADVPWVHFWEMEVHPVAPRPPLADRIAAGADPAMQLRVNHWPEMLTGWSSPYPVVLRGFTGDWYDAGQLHRAWATRQRWCRRGLLAERDDASETLANLDLWFIRYAFPAWSLEPTPMGEFQEAMHKMLDFFGAPFGIHWYNWHNFSWHRNYPSHFPVAEGFQEVLEDLQERGVVVMPYNQGRLLYRDRPTLETDRSHATVEANGQPYLEKYTDQDDWPLALCPMDPWSQMQWIETARTHWRVYGTDGVYFDQITAMPPSLCYHAGHGHPPGGGNWYWRGYDEALAAMAWMIEEDPDRFLSSELMADAFMDRVDLYLTFVPPIEDYVPLHAAIYSGYTTVMGRSTPDQAMADLRQFAILQGEQFLFGGQIGWMHDAILNHPQSAAYLRDLTRLRAQVRRYLHFGIMLRPLPLQVSGDPITLTLSEAVSGKNRPVAVTRDAVRNTVWQSPEGGIALLLLNEAEDARTITFALPDWMPAGAWTCHKLGAAEPSAVTLNGTVTLTVPGLGAMALVHG